MATKTAEIPVDELYLYTDDGGDRDEIEKNLRGHGLSIAVVPEEWIRRQCMSMERERILIRGVNGELVFLSFTWGRLLQFTSDCYLRKTVAIRVPKGNPIPKGAWRYIPRNFDRPLPIEMTLFGSGATTMLDPSLG